MWPWRCTVDVEGWTHVCPWSWTCAATSHVFSPQWNSGYTGHCTALLRQQNTSPLTQFSPLGLSVTQPKRVIRSNFPVGQLCLSSEIQTTCTITLWIFSKMLIFWNVNIKPGANCLTLYSYQCLSSVPTTVHVRMRQTARFLSVPAALFTWDNESFAVPRARHVEDQTVLIRTCFTLQLSLQVALLPSDTQDAVSHNCLLHWQPPTPTVIQRWQTQWLCPTMWSCTDRRYLHQVQVQVKGTLSLHSFFWIPKHWFFFQ